MVFDSTRGVAVLVQRAGYDDASLLQTWEWDGATWALRCAAGPPAVANPAMAYDSQRSVSVLFGGYEPYEGTLSGQTWEWNGSTWRLRSSTGPSPRSYTAMAYDSIRGVTVLYGGLGEDALSSETWEWDGAAWQLRATSGPSPREAHAMAFDAARGVAVLHGGLDDGSGYHGLGDTWEWDGVAWTLASTSGPSPRRGHAMAFDTARGVTVLVGADDNGETWEWNGTAWSPRAISAPAPRDLHGMAYDQHRGVTVLFGGYGGDGDTWEWNGDLWTLRGGGGPVQRAGHAMAYDAGRQAVVLFGGTTGDLYEPPLGDTWEWNGTSWTQFTSAGPSGRIESSIAYDSGRGRVVLFGGVTKQDTWERVGTTWSLAATTGPSARGYAVMAYDEARSVIVLFGGVADTYLSDTWEWDGTMWVQRSSVGPPLWPGYSMAYDASIGRVVLFGESADDRAHGQIWSWDGTTWSLSPACGATALRFAQIAYDTQRSTLVLFGGRDDSLNPRNQTWELHRDCAPAIIGQPASRTVASGDWVPFSANAGCDPSVSYQWCHNGVPIGDDEGFSGVDTPSLSKYPVMEQDTGLYTVAVTNSCGVAVSDAAELSVICCTPNGDLNADGTTDALDIQPFVEIILAGYSTAWDRCRADFGGDGAVNELDIPSFLNKFLGT
ncbi:MAG TPA: kelch repeat-containing protein [Phycisphaerae bacterium]|nr:kelch repeat-containing protein [Phycisphaerae bacterium]